MPIESHRHFVKESGYNAVKEVMSQFHLVHTIFSSKIVENIPVSFKDLDDH